MMPFNDLQLRNAALHAVQCFFQLLIGPDVLPQNIDIDLFLVQHIGIHKVFDIVDRPESQRFGNQGKKLVFNPTEARLYHLLRLYPRLTPHFYFSAVGAAKFCDGSGNFPLKKHVLRKPGVIHQIADRRLLPLGSGIDHRSHHKILLFTILIKFQRNMCADSTRPLIRPVLFSRLTAYIARQLPLSVFMGSLVEIICGAGDHKLDRIQKGRLSGPVFPGKKRRRSELYGGIDETVPVNQLHSRQRLHPSLLLFCRSLIFHKPV